MKSSTLTHVRVHAQSKDGRLLAVASDTGYVTLFDAETGQLVSTFPGTSSVASPPTLHLARLLTLALAPMTLNALSYTLHSPLESDPLSHLHLGPAHHRLGRQAHQRIRYSCAYERLWIERWEQEGAGGEFGRARGMGRVRRGKE